MKQVTPKVFDLILVSEEGTRLNWLLWVKQDSEGHRAERLFAGRVKLQDDPIATTHAVFQGAFEQLEAALQITPEDPLF